MIHRSRRQPSSSPRFESLEPRQLMTADLVLAADATSSLPLVSSEVSIIESPTQGIISVVDDQLHYTPKSGYEGVDSFQYSTFNDFGEKVTHTMNVQVGDLSAPSIGTLDTTHYLPPLYGRENVTDHFLYLSTPSEQEFAVTVRDGAGNLIGVELISAGASARVDLNSTEYADSGPGNNRGVLAESELNRATTRDGLILEADQPFYANLRHTHAAQGLSLTAKGTAAAGVEFRIAHLPQNLQSAERKSNFISVMATADNTVVNFSEYDARLEFVGGVAPTSVTLSAGESYVVAVHVDDNPANAEGLMGALVTADQPVVVHAGSWLGGNQFGGGRDIGVDQLLPANLVGTEYIMIQGMGPSDESERVMIVAHRDGTDVVVKDGAKPIATLNAGEFLSLDAEYYDRDSNAMYVRTSHPAYVFQSLVSNAVGTAIGFNFVPALTSAMKPQDIVIPDISSMGHGRVTVTAGAATAVYINGSQLTSGKPVLGKPSHVVYEATPQAGDTIVSADGPISVDFNIANEHRGAAGYFAGVPNVFATNDSILGEPGEPLTIDVLANDLADGFDFWISGLESPENGVIERRDGVLVYTPHDGFYGVDRVRYTVSGNMHGVTLHDTATIEVSIQPGPVAVDDLVATKARTVVIRALANDEAAGGNIRVESFTQGEYGKVKLVGNQQFQYKLTDKTFSGRDSFSYTITDELGNTSEAIVTIHVLGDNEAPVLESTQSANWMIGDEAVTLDNGIHVNDADSRELTGATVTISENYLRGEDVLSVDTQGAKIVAKFDEVTGALLLSGKDTVKNYQEVLRRVQYSNLADEPNTDVRRVMWTVSDGQAVGMTARATSLQVNGLSTLRGRVELHADTADEALAGLVFNNRIQLTGVNDRGESVEAEVFTDIDGAYAFDGLRPGEYTIRQHQPPQVVDGRDEAGDLGGRVANDEISAIVIDAGVSGVFDGYIFHELGAASVSGFVYLDNNGDGRVNGMEPGVSMVAVQLTGADDRGHEIQLETTTDRFGHYQFTGLRPGVYRVTETQPERLIDGKTSIGSLSGVASDNTIHDIVLGAGDQAQQYNFGEYLPSSLSGGVFGDTDIDGAMESHDIPLEGVEIRLTGVDANGADVDVVTHTDADGSFRFDHLLPGVYELTETQPDGFVDGRDSLGRFLERPDVKQRNGVRGNDIFSEIQLRAGEDGIGYNFSEQLDYMLADSFDKTLVVEGTRGDDHFEFVAGEEFHNVTLNGETQRIDARLVYEVVFLGGEGWDRVAITGTELVEHGELRTSSGYLHSARWRVRVEESEQIRMDGNGGYDKVRIFDSAWDDLVKMTESYARIWSRGVETEHRYYHQADGFHRAYAYAGAGEDRAYFYDSKKDDTFRAHDSVARLFNRKSYNAAVDFERTYAYANSGGVDTMEVWDSRADGDVLEASVEYVRMYNDHYYNYGEGFEEVLAHGNEGGDNDRAYLHGSAGDDLLVSGPSETKLFTESVTFHAKQFERVYAYGEGGRDQAQLFDSILDDRLVARPNDVRLYNADYYLRAIDFGNVDAYSSRGGADRAYFYDSASDDTLVAMENEVRMYGEGFDNTSHGFSRAYAYSNNGGADRAVLLDSGRADTVKVDGSDAKMYGEGYYLKLTAFEQLEALFTDVNSHDRAFIFGSDNATIEQAGDLASIITEDSDVYIHNVDALLEKQSKDSPNLGDLDNPLLQLQELELSF